MVLGLIDFLLGGKKKSKIPKSGQASASLNPVGGNVNPSVDQQVNNLNPANNINQGSNNLEFVQEQQQQTQPSQTQVNPQPSSSGGRKISEVIGKIHEELKKTNDKIGNLVTDIKSLENSVNNLGHRVDDLEEYKKTVDEKLASIDNNMTKFLSLYELINNQYNPFVEKEMPKQVVLSQGNSESESNDNSKENNSVNFDELKSQFEEFKKDSVKQEGNDLDSALLQLDTLDIEQAAGDAVPLKSLKNNTNSLVVILSWLEYLIKRVGVEKTRDTLRYYTETLRWITPEVFFDLDKYLKGMSDNENLTGNETLTVKDHIVSLYFISKLNEKTLDEKLTKAVLQIIKE
jgi:flagellar protein FlaD